MRKKDTTTQFSDLFLIHRYERIIMMLILILIASLWLLPLYSMLNNALKVGGLDNFRQVIIKPVNGIPFLRYFWNSFVVAIGSSSLTVIISALAVFSFSNIHFFGRNIIYYIVISCLTISAVIIAVPLFYILKTLHLYNTVWAVILPEVAQTMPFAVLMIKTYYDHTPLELMESAQIDGANSAQVFHRIFFPIAKPVLINLGVLQIMWSFQDFYIPLMYLTKQSLFTATIAVNVYKGLYGTIGGDTGLYNAALTLIGIPAILIFIFAQQYIVKGITSGSVKE
jgi:raffinose/stachyose/melibiose transport system permease protein